MRPTHRHTYLGRQTDRQTDTHTHTHTHLDIQTDKETDTQTLQGPIHIKGTALSQVLGSQEADHWESNQFSLAL